MRRYLIAAGIIIAVILLLIAGVFFYRGYLKDQPASENNLKDVTLSHEDVVNMTKPAAVRLIQHTTGKAELPDFKIDFTNFQLISNPEGPRKAVDIDEYLTGSGFIVNSQGYILTNSHVVSYQTVKMLLASDFGEEVLMREMDEYIKNSKGEPGQGINKLQAEELGVDLGKKILDYIITQGNFTIDKKVVVLDPSSSSEKKEDLINNGFPVKIISVNDNFYKDNKDVAMVKIDQDDLPSMRLGDSDKMAVGNKIMVIGFPASAEFNGKNLLESTFTDGAVNALKDSDDRSFKIFQSDAKMSEGSSGGPMLNEKGQVVGIITYGSSDLQREAGDNFAFALPINRASSWTSDYVVNPALTPSTLNESTYADHLLSGLRYAGSDHCQKALSEFAQAQSGNEHFSTGKYVDNYIGKCNALIASGNSIDTRWDEKSQELKKISTGTWIIIGGTVLFLIIAIFVIIYLIEKLRKDEKEMHDLEDQVYSQAHPNEKKETAGISDVSPGTKETPIIKVVEKTVPQEAAIQFVDKK